MKKIVLILVMLNIAKNLTAQNVGIGTTTPSEKLQVSNGNIGLLNTIDSKSWRFTYVQADDRFAIQEDGSSRLSIANGGNVGVGTIVPNTKAILDIGSTTRGVLFPRMTTSQKFAIATPPNGLMVYDIDRNELSQYDGSTWRAMLNSVYWVRSVASRKIISNLSDSVGIGTNSPTEWLDVDGNIRARNNLMADNDVVINNTTATLQLQSSSVNKGYLQLSGNNVRMGTNSGNSTGNLIIRMNSNDRITIDPSGNMDIDGKITRSAITGNKSLLPVCMGMVNSDGSIAAGTGNFTINIVSLAGYHYEILCSQVTPTSIIIVTPLNIVTNPYSADYYGAGKMQVYCTSPIAFQFVVYNL